MCICMCACVRACVCACVRACVRACMRVCACVPWDPAPSCCTLARPFKYKSTSLIREKRLSTTYHPARSNFADTCGENESLRTWRITSLYINNRSEESASLPLSSQQPTANFDLQIQFVVYFDMIPALYASVAVLRGSLAILHGFLAIKHGSFAILHGYFAISPHGSWALEYNSFSLLLKTFSKLLWQRGPIIV